MTPRRGAYPAVATDRAQHSIAPSKLRPGAYAGSFGASDAIRTGAVAGRSTMDTMA